MADVKIVIDMKHVADAKLVGQGRGVNVEIKVTGVVDKAAAEKHGLTGTGTLYVSKTWVDPQPTS